MLFGGAWFGELFFVLGGFCWLKWFFLLGVLCGGDGFQRFWSRFRYLLEGFCVLVVFLEGFSAVLQMSFVAMRF